MRLNDHNWPADMPLENQPLITHSKIPNLAQNIRRKKNPKKICDSRCRYNLTILRSHNFKFTHAHIHTCAHYVLVQCRQMRTSHKTSTHPHTQSFTQPQVDISTSKIRIKYYVHIPYHYPIFIPLFPKLIDNLVTNFRSYSHPVLSHC